MNFQIGNMRIMGLIAISISWLSFTKALISEVNDQVLQLLNQDNFRKEKMRQQCVGSVFSENNCKIIAYVDEIEKLLRIPSSPAAFNHGITERGSDTTYPYIFENFIMKRRY